MLSKAETNSDDSNSTSIYTKVTHEEHIQIAPDTYVGSIENEKTKKYVLDNSDENNPKIVLKEIEITPGLYKIFDEILVNAEDHEVRLSVSEDNTHPITAIKMYIDQISGEISIYNDGEGIDVIKLEQYDSIYAATMIFGKLLSGANFDQEKERIWGGKNGYGAKLANIFSKYFIVETVDSKRSLYFKQRFREHMKIIEEPEIKKYTKKPFTRITFLPDYQRFNMTGITDDTFSLFMKRAYDVSAWTSNKVSVYFNDKLLKTKNFVNYVDLYLPKEQERIHEKINDRWEIVLSYSNDDIFKQVSFVNGISTTNGGKHVEYILDQIKDKVVDQVKKKKKIDIRPNTVRNQLFLFVKSVIVNPCFDSQTKETLTTNKKKFGSTAILSDKFFTKLMKSCIIDKIVMENEYKNKKNLKKNDGKKSRKIVGIPKLCDANKAGGKESKKCTLILTEGDSAKTTAVAGLSVVGRDYYGVFPLKGKVLNVKDVTDLKIQKNEEIKNLVKIIGLKYNEEYSFDPNAEWKLRYGKIIIMTDQDHDGSHIKGLVINLFHTFWPTLFRNPFLSCLVTPIVKCFKGKLEINFYTIPEYESWKDSITNIKSWKIKYYKGLGTSSVSEAKKYFQHLNIQTYIFDEKKSNDSIYLAFDKKKANLRKNWLSKYDHNETLDFGKKDITYDDFINRELIHFSQADNRRSIPDIRDGLKPSQRKVIFGCFKKKNYDSEIKVTQLAGYVSEHSSYHHGEVSLHSTIISLAQDFVGSNNINLLYPSGQFGSRLQGGKDASSSRYIFTRLSKITHLIYRKEDMEILEYLNDDGFPIEPLSYYPIICMILVNGGKGIGTGYSTNIPNHNPKDIITALLNKLDGKDFGEIKPYYRGFVGDIYEKENDSKKNYYSQGKFKLINQDTIEITELPVGVWTDDYKSFLDTCVKDKVNDGSKNKQFIKSYVENSTESKVSFTIKFTESLFNLTGCDTNKIYDLLKLKNSINTNVNNMVLYNGKSEITKYNNVNDILSEFYDLRLDLYDVRKKHLLKSLRSEADVLKNKYEYIQFIITDKLDIRNKLQDDLDKEMEELGLQKIDDTYDYLTDMKMRSLSKEKVEELEKKYNNKMQEIKNLESKTPKMIWREELIELRDFIENEKVSKTKKNKK